MADLPPYPGTPRWVKVFGIVTIIIIVLVGIILLGGHLAGGHGPNLHMGSGNINGNTPPSSITEGHTPPVNHSGQ